MLELAAKHAHDRDEFSDAHCREVRDGAEHLAELRPLRDHRPRFAAGGFLHVQPLHYKEFPDLLIVFIAMPDWPLPARELVPVLGVGRIREVQLEKFPLIVLGYPRQRPTEADVLIPFVALESFIQPWRESRKDEGRNRQ